MAASLRRFALCFGHKRTAAKTSFLCQYKFNLSFCVKSVSSHSQYCLELVRKHDYEHFLCSLFLPDSAISSVLAIRAFNVEVATIRDVISDQRHGQMRMVFLKEALNKIYSGIPPSQPVAMELGKAVQKHKLSKRWLSRILEEREKMLDDRPFHTVEEIESYAENTSSSLLYLTLEALGIKDVNADHAASHIGRAQGLTTILRAVPHNAQHNIVNLPLDIMAKHGLTQTAAVRGPHDQPMKDVVYDIASQAHVHLTTAKSCKESVPASALPVFLCTASLSSYLKKIQKYDFDVFHPKTQKKDSLLPFRLWLQNKKRTY